MKKLTVGVIGCGMISKLYLQNMLTKFSDIIEVVACADICKENAEKRAEEFGISCLSVEDLLGEEKIQMILNLTVPAAHFEISKRALEAGKHVYSEKPLAVTYQEGKELIDLANQQNLLIASAPDTFLGAGMQTCKKILDDGMIGQVVGAHISMLSSGPETFHPNPQFLYKKGAGPLFDIGPYYLAALVHLLGPVKRVCGISDTFVSKRTIKNPESPFYQDTFETEVDTTVKCILDFESGGMADLIFSWDVPSEYDADGTSSDVIYGTKGKLLLPSPNDFTGTDGEPFIYLLNKNGKEKVSLVPGRIDNCRGIGMVELAKYILDGSKSKVTDELSLHVLEIMHGVFASADDGKYYEMETTLK